MEGPTAYHNLRGPSPIVWAMRTRIAPPPPLAEPIPKPVYPPPPPPQAPLPPPRRRVRPRLPPPPAAHGQGDLGGLQPHVLTIAAGEDIISRVVAISQINAKAICVLSAFGAVKEAILLQPSGAISNHKGPLEIIRLVGSILTYNDLGCLRVTLASVDSSVISGIIAGPLIAATTIQAILGSFQNDAYCPNNAPKAAAACYPNSQVTISNGSPLSSECPSSGYANNAPRAAAACYPNSQVTISNGSPLSSEHPSSGYAHCTSVKQNESYEIDVKPSLGVGLT